MELKEMILSTLAEIENIVEEEKLNTKDGQRQELEENIPSASYKPHHTQPHHVQPHPQAFNQTYSPNSTTNQQNNLQISSSSPSHSYPKITPSPSSYTAGSSSTTNQTAQASVVKNMAHQTKEDDKNFLPEEKFLILLKERCLVLFEGLQAPNNKKLESKIELILNFLEYTLAITEQRLEAKRLLNIFFIFFIFTNLSFANEVDNFEINIEQEFENKVSKKEIFDPIEPYNRAMNNVNDFFYINIFDPVASKYAYVVPRFLRVGISNMYQNIKFPLRFANNLLQLKFQNGIDEFNRFAINSTIGILGFFDRGREFYEIPSHDEDFGQTLGHYGVGSGFYIVLPFFGPSNLRDLVGFGVHWYAEPLNYISDRSYNILDNDTQGFYVSGAETINNGENLMTKYKSLKKDAIDIYPFFREIYENRRNKMIEE